jgi:hypothetical protein
MTEPHLENANKNPITTQTYLVGLYRIAHASQRVQEIMPGMAEIKAQWRFIHAVRKSGDETSAQARFFAMKITRSK